MTNLSHKSPEALLIFMHGVQHRTNPNTRCLGHHMDGFKLSIPITTVSTNLSPTQTLDFLLDHYSIRSQTISVLTMFDTINFEFLKLNNDFSTESKMYISDWGGFCLNLVSCSLAFESDLSKSNCITWIDYKLHFPYWVFLWAVQKRLLTTQQEKYIKYNL